MKMSLDIKREGRIPRAFAQIRPWWLDRVEQVVLVLLWSVLLSRVIASHNGYASLLLLSETTVLVFVLIRRPTLAISRNPGDWMLAITATAAPLLIRPEGPPLLGATGLSLAPLGVALVLAGTCWQALAKLTLRRSFGVAPANRGVKVAGPYAVMRHPMYAGYLLAHIGNLVLFPSIINVVIYAIGWWSQVLRLLAEESLLSGDEAYRAYCGKVRWRLIPGLF
jgi:protein-S-isoprenylcysteine O-methyltransferase Ste14